MTTLPPPMPEIDAVLKLPNDIDGNLEYHNAFTEAKVLDRDAQFMERITSLEAALKKANDQAEHFEREWYLRGDAIEKLEADRKMLREALNGLEGSVPTSLECHDFHHKKADQHFSSGYCKPKARFVNALIAARTALENTK